MGISVAVLLAAASPATLPAQVVVAPWSADPAVAVAQSRLRRPVITWAFAAPTPMPDLRAFTSKTTRTNSTSMRAEVPRLAPVVADVEGSDGGRLDTLVVGDPEAQFTGRRVRTSRMAAGLSLKLVQDGTLLQPLVGVAGSAGRALTRIALEAANAE